MDREQSKDPYQEHLQSQETQVTFLSEDFTDIVDKELSSAQNLHKLAQEMIRVIEEKREQLLASRLAGLTSEGYPKQLASLCTQSSVPVAMKGAKASALGSLTIGSADGRYFAPKTGRPQKIDARTDLMEKMERKAEFHHDKPHPAETEFFDRVGKDLLKVNILRRNVQSFFWKSLPHIHATPDGFVYSGIHKKVAVVEVKQCNSSKSTGIRMVKGTEEKPQYEVVPGHDWETQVIFHMMTTGLNLAYLAVKQDDEWRICRVEYDNNKSEMVAKNVEKRYRTLLKRFKVERADELKVFNKKGRGRPKKSTCQRQRRFFVGNGTCANLDYELEDPVPKIMAVERGSSAEQGDEEDEKSSPFLN